MKSFSRTLTLPFIVAALTGCGGGGGSDEQSSEIVSLLTTGLSYFQFSGNSVIEDEEATLQQSFYRFSDNTLPYDARLFNGVSWEPISRDEDPYYVIVWNGTEWAVYNEQSDCTMQPSTSSNKLISTCHPGNVFDIRLVSSAIAGTSIQAAMQDILEEAEWLYSTEVDAIQEGIDDITGNFSNDARAYQMQIEQVTGNVELNCDVDSENTSSTPELTAFSCESISGATSFDDLFENEIVFDSGNDSDIYLTRASDDATSGNIMSGEEVIAQWSLVTIEGGLEVLQLTMGDDFDNEYNALVVYNDEVIDASYIPANSSRGFGLLFNSTAVDELTEALSGVFPVIISQ